MKKFTSIVVVGLLIISGFVLVSADSEQLKTNSKNVCFSQLDIKEKNDYVTISVNEADSYLIKSGMPVLPAYDETFIFPFGTKITNVNCKVLNVEEIRIEKEIEISPEPVIIGFQDVASEKINTKKVSYSIYPDKWYDYDVGCGIIDNTLSMIVKVQVYPVQHNLDESLLRYASDVDISIEYKTPQNPATFDEEYRLIILAPEEFIDELEPLVTHKNSIGLSAISVSLSEIYDGTYFPAEGRDNAEKVKYFIKSAVETWGASYILLVGGSLEFPTRETHVKVSNSDTEIFVSDLYFADIYNETGGFCSWDSNENSIFAEYDWGTSHLTDDLDLYPDVYLGRLACINGAEVSTSVDKIITYETTEAYTKDWFTNLITLGGDSFPPDNGDDSGVDEGEFVNEEIIGVMEGFIPTRLWATNGELGGLNGVGKINDAINAGAGFIDFSGHGNPSVWATHPHNGSHSVWLPTPTGGYKNTHAGNLENGDELPIVVVGACSTSKYNEKADCFTWSFVSNPDGGGIGTFGATALGYAYIGEWVTSGLVERMAISMFEAYKDGATSFGEIWSRGINLYIKPGLDAGDYKTIEEWQPFGDPSLAIASQSEAPDKPAKPEGESNGKINTQYTYSSSATDPEGEEVLYLFDWGDDEYSGWLGPFESGEVCEAQHSWSAKGDYEIRVKAKDEHGVQSEWSDPLSVSMPRSKNIDYPTWFTFLLERFPRLSIFLENLGLILD